MNPERKPQRRRGWFIAGLLLIAMGLLSSQAYSAAYTVTSEPLQNAGTAGAVIHSSDWIGASTVVTRHEKSTVTVNVSDLVTAVTVDGTKVSGAANVKVDLLNASATILDTATVALPSATGLYNTLATLTSGTTPYSQVAKVSAVYTVPTPQTFGKTTIGVFTTAMSGPQTIVSKYTAPAAGTITSISVYLALASDNPWDLVLYSDSAGSPGTLLRSASTTGVAGWNTVAITSYSMTLGEVLWMGTSISGNNLSVSWDTGATNQWASNTAYLAATFGTPTFAAQVLSVYVTYTP